MPLLWRIYYGDGSTYSNEDGSPFAAPPDNVQAVVYVDKEHGRIINAMRDFYWWVEAENEWWGGDLFGVWDYLRQPGPKKVIFARSVNHAQYNAVIKEALATPDFPPKSAIAPGERF
jgi:hypothetical protein